MGLFNLRCMLVKSTQIYSSVCKQQILILQTTTTNTTYNESNIPTCVWFVQCICNVLLKVLVLIVGLNYHEMYPIIFGYVNQSYGYWTCMKGSYDHFMVK